MFKTGRETKEQHYVPKMYLKHFTFDGKRCYTLNDSNEINCQYTTEICKKKNQYELKNNNGEIVWKNYFEKKVFKPAEDEFEIYFNEWKEAINKCDALIDNLNDNKYRRALIWFMVSLLLRNRTTISITQSVGLDVGIRWTEREARNNGILNSVTLQEHFTSQWEKEYNVIIHINRTSVPFVTSDFPFVVYPFDADSWRFWYFPVFPNCLVILEPRQLTGMKHTLMFASPLWFVRAINRLFSIQNKALLISNDIKSLEQLREWRSKYEFNSD